MKRAFLLSTLFICSIVLFAYPKVTLAELNNGGWERYKGQTITITTTLYVNALMFDSILVAPERLFVPEERCGLDLAKGDSTTYYYWKHYNDSLRIKLECRYPYDLNIGATIRNLTAQVAGVRHLQSGHQPTFKNFKPSKKLPDLGDANLVICAANVENYFTRLGGYATKKVTQGQHALQELKVATALHKLNADIYCLCELQQGDEAPAEIVAKMNKIAKKDIYAFVLTDTIDRDTISVGYLYRKDKVRPVGDLCYAYDNLDNVYAHRFMLQGFEDIKTGEQLVISVNHPKSKRGGGYKSNASRVKNIAHVLSCLAKAYRNGIYTDRDVLLVGDYNAYGKEESVQRLVAAGFTDLVAKYAGLDYSYTFNGELGFLDRAFASPTMIPQITAVKPVHWNTDFHYSASYKYKYNYKNRNIPKDAPKDIRKLLSPEAKRNLIFRYSDHDPLLIGVKLRSW